MSLPNEIVAASSKMRETNDCAVKAIAIATSTPYVKVHRLCRQAGRRPRKGTHLNIMKRVLAELGWKIHYRPEWKGKTATTLKVPFSGRYIAFTSQYRHALALRGGLVKDWTDGRRHRIIRVWEIYK